MFFTLWQNKKQTAAQHSLYSYNFQTYRYEKHKNTNYHNSSTKEVYNGQYGK